MTAVTDGLPSRVTIRVDDLLPGSYTVEDLWDGVSTVGPQWEPEYLIQVPDENDDGIADYWAGNQLLAGPLLGQSVSEEQILATTADNDGWAWAADFDADGDGHGDILQTGATGDCAYIRYGPFTGDLPSVRSGDADPNSYTVLGDCFNDNLLPGAWVLPDHYDGRDGVVFGVAGTIADSYAYVLEQPRGARIPTSAAQATYSMFNLTAQPNWADLGDVDGDGQRDYLFGYNSNLYAARGPLRFDAYRFGDESDPDAPDRLFKIDDPNQTITGAIADLNGDGIMELSALQAFNRDPYKPGSGTTWPVIAFSPFDEPNLDLSCALPLSYQGDPLYGTRAVGTITADLDGDGLVDLVVQHQGTDNILIWWGRDLVEAHADLQP